MAFPEKYDKPKEKTTGWHLHGILLSMKISKLPKTIPFAEIDSPEIQQLMNEDSLEP